MTKQGRGAGSILLASDFQQPARRAFMYGVHLTRTLNARLHILHVIKTLSDSPDRAPDRRSIHSLKTSALLELGRLTRVAREAGASAEPLVLYGVPSVCILNTVKRVHAGMIVIGTEGRTGWDRLRLGSTAQTIVQEAPCPVLTVHGGLAGDAVRHPARARLQRLLVATDFSPFADAVLDPVSELASVLHATVCLFHAAEPSGDRTKADRLIAERIERLRGQGVETEGACMAGDPVETILSQAAVWRADVIAVGTQGRRGLTRVVLGSVAEALLKRAGCPVLTVKAAGRPERARPHRRTRKRG